MLLAVKHCQLCQRQTLLTFHHLIPRKMHRRSRFNKKYSKAELQQGVYLCRLCHKAIHKQYDEITLAQRFNTLELLLADDAIQRHLQWAAKQK
ncbi:HNH endonuclease [Alishewanella sp. SMS8]|uniref:HNH endonuclease n=1 Tax=unclassified Alishewanella TaxID=2628974 RepID=UPI00274173DD|nr:HNH endonuclease [Alishewanella sp. SMS8]MDP5460662.1 hypothetical protein [Alishewanella sp. SMS8]